VQWGLQVWNIGREQGRVGVERRKIETGISALDLLELLLGFLQVLHAAGGGELVRMPSLQSNRTGLMEVFSLNKI
jgi:hypothetical protein